METPTFQHNKERPDGDNENFELHLSKDLPESLKELKRISDRVLEGLSCKDAQGAVRLSSLAVFRSQMGLGEKS